MKTLFMLGEDETLIYPPYSQTELVDTTRFEDDEYTQEYQIFSTESETIITKNVNSGIYYIADSYEYFKEELHTSTWLPICADVVIQQLISAINEEE